MASIQGVYVALFGRPADPTGLNYFNGVTNNGADLAAIGDLAATAEYKARFEGKSSQEIITSIYQSLFDRNPEQAGLDFFVSALANGTFNINNIAIAILDGALGADKTLVDKKIAAANLFTAAIDTPDEIAAYSGTAAAGQGIAFVDAVTASSTVVDAAAAQAAVSNIKPGADAIFTLTTGVDVLSGTAGADTFVGTASATTPTMNLGDQISGGAGADTLRVVSDLAGAIPSIQTTGIETYQITSNAAATLAVNGLTTDLAMVDFSGGSNNTFGLTGIGTGVGVALTNEAGQLTITYDSVGGSADVASLTLNGAKSTASVAAAGIETFNVMTTGTASTLAALTGGQGQNLNITGDQNLTVTAALANTFTTIDASAATGNMSLGVTAGGDAKVTTGSGDDRVDMAGGLDANDTVDLGAGSDTIAVSSADLSNAGVVTAISAVKNAEIVETTAVGAVIVDGNALNAVTSTFKVSGAMAAAATGAAISVDAGNMADTDIIQISADRAGSAVAAAADNSGNTGSDGVEITSLVDNGANVATIQLLGGVDIVGAAGGESNAGVANGGAGGLGIDAATIETLNISSTGTVANSIAGGAGGATLGGAVGAAGASVAVNTNGKIAVTGTQDLNLGTISGTNATVDASALTGKLTVTGEAGANTLIGGSAADTLTGGTGTDTLTGGAGVDKFVFNTATDSEASATGLDADVITDYSSDILQLGAANNVAGASAVAGTTATSNVEVNASGLVSFAAADDTLAKKLVALAADDTDIANNETVLFQHGSDTYVYGAGANTANAADDFLIKLTGVSLTSLTESTATPGDFMLA